MENAWVCKYSDKELTVFYAGLKTEFKCAENCVGAVSENTVADITVSNGVIINSVSKGERMTDKILAVTDTYIETSQYGRLALSPTCKIYGLYSDTITQLNTESILVGYSSADMVVNNGSICALLVTSKVKPNSIRVALMTNNYGGYYHDNAEIISDCGMVVTCAGNQTNIKAGEKLSLNRQSELSSKGRVTITPVSGGKLTVTTIKRSNGCPSYRGSLDISLREEGLIIVNELPIEEYLYAVVHSEMPVSYGAEPLKVQAVCARSYAYMQVMSNALASYGAHVDDSTSYQVYNNTPESAESIDAVNQTAGQLLTYNGEVVSTYYFSTSCGHTSSGNDVWFGMKNVPYLQGGLQNVNSSGEVEAAAVASSYADLSDNDVFKKFINDASFKTYDSGFPWYRWRLKLSADEIKASLEASIAKRYKINPSLILTQNDDGNYVSEPVESIGRIKSIKIDKRSAGGIVTSIIIKGSKKTVKVLSEYNIRLMLAPVSSQIIRNDKSTVNGLALLPSAFISIESESADGKKIFSIMGGGYGHGVGMSQNGAKTMAESGAGYIDILKHYYNGCEVTS